jgi:hypothetical protein
MSNVGPFFGECHGVVVGSRNRNSSNLSGYWSAGTCGIIGINADADINGNYYYLPLFGFREHIVITDCEIVYFNDISTSVEVIDPSVHFLLPNNIPWYGTWQEIPPLAVSCQTPFGGEMLMSFEGEMGGQPMMPARIFSQGFSPLTVESPIRHDQAIDQGLVWIRGSGHPVGGFPRFFQGLWFSENGTIQRVANGSAKGTITDGNTGEVYNSVGLSELIYSPNP